MENRDWRDRTDARYAQLRRSERLKAESAAYVEKARREQEERMLFAGNKRAAGTAMKEYQKLLGHRQAVAPDIRLMTDQQLAELGKELLKAEKYDWSANARPEQIFPENCVIWLLMCGRGWGKTRAAAEKVRQVCETPNMRVAMIAKDHRALRDVCLEGVSGLLACIPPEQVKKIHKGLGDVSIELVNGSTIKGYTAGEPDAIRGMSYDMAWCDEFAAWPRNRAQDMLDQVRLCMRESKAGAICILSTTPRRIPHVMDIVKLAADPAERITIAQGRSRDNTALDADWHRQMERKFAGTRLGRQELEGELLTDVENALWTGRMIDECRWDPDEDMPPLQGVITGVDPSGSSDGDATGIVTVGWTRDKRIIVLDNRTTKGAPLHRYSEVCRSMMTYGAGEGYFESAYGGDNAAFGIQQAWKTLQEQGEIPIEKRCPPLRPSTIKGDKAARAMPVVALYEQGVARPDLRRIWHVEPNGANGIAEMEDELLGWDTTSKLSPNALDALVHACRQVMRKLGMEATISSPASPLSTRRIKGGYEAYRR